ncbi:MAG: carbohydrate kinase family protein [Butyricicoccus sp.]|nr:carbohydrate kinase family protein [Butyricicoccus sp.]
MKKVIAAGHICLDITPVIPHSRTYSRVGELLEPGKLLNVEQADVHTGGSVANTGLALKKLGVDVTLMGKAGADAFGALLSRLLEQHGAGGLLADAESSTSYSVVLAIPGIDRIFLHNPGANDTFSNRDIPDAALTDAALFHFGYPPLMKKMYQDGGAELTAIFRRMKEKGIATSLDFAAVDPNSEAGRADWGAIIDSVLPWVDFFVPSFEELCFMLDRGRYERLAAKGGDMTRGLDMASEAKPLADSLMERGGRAVLIKCGTAGMYYRTASRAEMERAGSRLGLDAELWANQEGVQPSFKADIVRSATGAGDASIAAFLAAVLRGKPPRECAALAAAEGACSVTAYDALSGLKPLEELEARINAGWEAMR